MVQDNSTRKDETKADPAPTGGKSFDVSKEEKTLLVSPYQKQLIAAWEQSHPGQDAPILDAGNGYAHWMNRHERRAHNSRLKKAYRKGLLVLPAETEEVAEQVPVITDESTTKPTQD